MEDEIQNGGIMSKHSRGSENINGFCENTAGLLRGKFLDLDVACLNEVSLVKMFQFHNMLDESEGYRATANGLIVGCT